jgi:hypothetical protein
MRLAEWGFPFNPAGDGMSDNLKKRGGQDPTRMASTQPQAGPAGEHSGGISPRQH